jgi:hypothetical protein
MKIKYPGSMNGTVTAVSTLLLKKIHVANLNIIMRVYMIGNSGKKPVLVKIITHDLFPEIDMDFIIQDQRKISGFYLSTFQWIL